jgi:hypothetical protein
MYLHRDDLTKMLEILEKFPDVESVEVLSDNSSGIGAVTTMRLTTTVNGVEGTLEVEISGVESW